MSIVNIPMGSEVGCKDRTLILSKQGSKQGCQNGKVRGEQGVAFSEGTFSLQYR